MQLSNKKLVDRGTRMLVDMLGLEYGKAKSLLLLHGSVEKALEAYKTTDQWEKRYPIVLKPARFEEHNPMKWS